MGSIDVLLSLVPWRSALVLALHWSNGGHLRERAASRPESRSRAAGRIILEISTKNASIFNDGAFAGITDRKTGDQAVIFVEHVSHCCMAASPDPRGTPAQPQNPDIESVENFPITAADDAIVYDETSKGLAMLIAKVGPLPDSEWASFTACSASRFYENRCGKSRSRSGKNGGDLQQVYEEATGRSSKVPAPYPSSFWMMSAHSMAFSAISTALMTYGRLIPEALQGLQRAQAAGLKVIPVTGRPAGWVDQIARLWPVDGVVGENGGLWFWMDDAGLRRGFIQDLETRRTNRERLNRLQQQILADVPRKPPFVTIEPIENGSGAVDFCEDVAPLSRELIDRIIRDVSTTQATCKRGQHPHINGWFGHFDKLAGFQTTLSPMGHATRP